MIPLSFRQTRAEMMLRTAATLLFTALEKNQAQRVPLRSLITGVQYGYTASATTESVGPRFVRITDLKDGKIHWENVPYCECPDAAPYALHVNDILFARTGATTGKTHLVSQLPKEPAVFASYLIRVRPNHRVIPGYLAAFFLSEQYWTQIVDQKEGSAQPNVNGDKLSRMSVPIADEAIQESVSSFMDAAARKYSDQGCELPELLHPLTEQRRLVERIDALAAKIEEAKAAAEVVSQQNERLLRTVFHQLTQDVPRRKLGEIAPLTRRPATVDPFSEYPQVSVRSFGRGTFHNPPLAGSEITWEKPHLVKAGDILISNIKAWEGAIAVAGPDDDNRYGSHRYLTYVPVEGVVTARFLCFYLLTPEGLYHVGEASPGSADRNRTTSAKGLLEIPVPLPSYEQQVWFGELFDKIGSVKELQAETATKREAMLPAILDRAFRGEL